jgi:hypothetical protein
MAYNENLAQRVRAALGPVPGFEQKKMFGGVGFMVRGNMACGLHGDDLIVRVGPDRYEAALAEANTRPFDMTGRPMRGWIVVLPAGYASDSELERWVQHGLDFALTLPPK